VVESKHVGLIRTAQLVVADGNLSPPTFTKIVTLAKSYSVPVFFEPTSDHKCLLPVTTGVLGFIDVMKPNLSELCAIVSACLDLDLIMQVATCSPCPLSLSGALSHRIPPCPPSRS